MKKITTLIPTLTLIGTTALAVPAISSCSCNQSTSSTHIKNITSAKTVEVTDQDNTAAVFTFEANDSNLSADNLTAIIKVEEGQTTNFSVSAKGYIEVEGKTITLTVSFSASGITSMNDECKFDVYFTNAEPNNTWAEHYTGLSVKYTSPFLNSSLSTQEYVFFGKESGKRKMSLSLAKNSGVASVSVSTSVVEGKLKFKDNPTAEIEDDSINLVLPYDSTDVSEMESSKCEITLTANNFSQTYSMVVTAVDSVYPVSTKASVSKGSTYCNYDCALSLQLATTESISDFETIEIRDISADSTITPEFATDSKGWLNTEKDYITFYLRIKDSKVVKNGKATFSIYLKKKDNHETGGTQGWSKTIEGLTLSYTGKALTLTQNEFDSTSEGTITTGNLLSINIPFETYGTFDISELPTDIEFNTLKMTPQPSSGVTYYRWVSIFKEDSKFWNEKDGLLLFDTLWEFDPSSIEFEDNTYTHTIEIVVEWGDGVNYTQQVFDFTIKGSYKA